MESIAGTQSSSNKIRIESDSSDEDNVIQDYAPIKLKKRKKIFLISIILLIICTATIITYFNYLAATTPIYIDQVTYIYNDTEISYSTEILDTEQFN